METNMQSANYTPPIHWGHFGAVALTIVLILGMSWMEKPELFSFKKSSPSLANQQNVPRYYAYQAPPEDLQQSAVLGASTNPGPSVINEDGTVSPVDMGEVLGASTKDVVLSLDAVKVNAIADSPEAMQKYLADVEVIKNGPIDNIEFEVALSSNNQDKINLQAQKLISIRQDLQKLLVPKGLVKFHKLTIVQYQSAIGVLQNFTQADNNPELVGQYLQQFIKSQQDLDTETALVAQKYNLNPLDLGSTIETTVTEQNPQVIENQGAEISNLNGNNLNGYVPQ